VNKSLIVRSLVDALHLRGRGRGPSCIVWLRGSRFFAKGYEAQETASSLLVSGHVNI